MASRLIFTPQSAVPVGSNYPELKRDPRGRFVLAFDTATEETCEWEAAVPQGWSGTGTLVLFYKMASATSGGIRFGASVEAVTSGDAFDMDAGDSFDTENAASDTSVPGTAGYGKTLSITLTNQDSLAAGDYLRIRLARKVAHADDTASGDCEISWAELRDAA